MNLVKINIVYLFYDFCCCNINQYLRLALDDMYCSILNTRKPSKHLVIGQVNYATLHRSSEIDQIFQGMYVCLYGGALNYLRDCHSLMTALPEWAEAVLQLAYQILNSAITAALPITKHT